MQQITHLILHCSDSEWGNANEIRNWHKAKGWRDIGYHFVIQNGKPTYSHFSSKTYIRSLDGAIECGRDLDADSYIQDNEEGAHAFGYNRNSVGICVVGRDNITESQRIALNQLCLDLCKIYNILPENVLGHCETPSGKAQGKTCPNFVVGNVRYFLTSRLHFDKEFGSCLVNMDGSKHMNIPIFISIGKDIHGESTCGKDCAFFNVLNSHCTLFNEDLFFVQLPEGCEWQDEYSKSLARHDKCLIFDKENQEDI